MITASHLPVLAVHSCCLSCANPGTRACAAVQGLSQEIDSAENWLFYFSLLFSVGSIPWTSSPHGCVSSSASTRELVGTFVVRDWDLLFQQQSSLMSFKSNYPIPRQKWVQMVTVQLFSLQITFELVTQKEKEIFFIFKS